MTETEREELSRDERDWSDLPSDIVNLIVKKLPDLLEFIYFHAVCKRWRSSASISGPPVQVPWLLEVPVRDGYESLQPQTTKLRFHSITSGKTLTIPIKDKESRWFRGVSFHYLPFYDDHDGTISLLNPITNKEFVYPPIRGPDPMTAPWMVPTGTGPIEDRNIMVVDRNAYGSQIGQWAFYDGQDEKWSEEKGFLYKFCYWKGMLFSADLRLHTTRVVDVSSKRLLYSIQYPKEGFEKTCIKRSYIVESCGEILGLCWYLNGQRDIAEESVFDVYRLDFAGNHGQPRWIKISDIGDRILFLELRSGFSLTVGPSSGFQVGCIYFIEPFDGKPYVHRVGADTAESVSCPFKRCTWFVPTLS
jgi:Protein of unknown function (DUF295)